MSYKTSFARQTSVYQDLWKLSLGVLTCDTTQESFTFHIKNRLTEALDTDIRANTTAVITIFTYFYVCDCVLFVYYHLTQTVVLASR